MLDIKVGDVWCTDYIGDNGINEVYIVWKISDEHITFMHLYTTEFLKPAHPMYYPIDRDTLCKSKLKPLTPDILEETRNKFICRIETIDKLAERINGWVSELGIDPEVGG